MTLVKFCLSVCLAAALINSSYCDLKQRVQTSSSPSKPEAKCSKEANNTQANLTESDVGDSAIKVNPKTTTTIESAPTSADYHTIEVNATTNESIRCDPSDLQASGSEIKPRIIVKEVVLNEEIGDDLQSPKSPAIMSNTTRRDKEVSSFEPAPSGRMPARGSTGTPNERNSSLNKSPNKWFGRNANSLNSILAIVSTSSSTPRPELTANSRKFLQTIRSKRRQSHNLLAADTAKIARRNVDSKPAARNHTDFATSPNSSMSRVLPPVGDFERANLGQPKESASHRHSNWIHFNRLSSNEEFRPLARQLESNFDDEIQDLMLDGGDKTNPVSQPARKLSEPPVNRADLQVAHSASNPISRHDRAQSENDLSDDHDDDDDGRQEEGGDRSSFKGGLRKFKLVSREIQRSSDWAQNQGERPARIQSSITTIEDGSGRRQVFKHPPGGGHPGDNKLPAKLRERIIEQFVKGGGDPHNITMSDSTITTITHSKRKTITTVYKIVPSGVSIHKKLKAPFGKQLYNQSDAHQHDIHPGSGRLRGQLDAHTGLGLTQPKGKKLKKIMVTRIERPERGNHLNQGHDEDDHKKDPESKSYDLRVETHVSKDKLDEHNGRNRPDVEDNHEETSLSSDEGRGSVGGRKTAQAGGKAPGWSRKRQQLNLKQSPSALSSATEAKEETREAEAEAGVDEAGGGIGRELSQSDRGEQAAADQVDGDDKVGSEKGPSHAETQEDDRDDKDDKDESEPSNEATSDGDKGGTEKLRSNPSSSVEDPEDEGKLVEKRGEKSNSKEQAVAKKTPPPIISLTATTAKPTKPTTTTKTARSSSRKPNEIQSAGLIDSKVEPRNSNNSQADVKDSSGEPRQRTHKIMMVLDFENSPPASKLAVQKISGDSLNASDKWRPLDGPHRRGSIQQQPIQRSNGRPLDGATDAQRTAQVQTARGFDFNQRGNLQKDAASSSTIAKKPNRRANPISSPPTINVQIYNTLAQNGRPSGSRPSGRALEDLTKTFLADNRLNSRKMPLLAVERTNYAIEAKEINGGDVPIFEEFSSTRQQQRRQRQPLPRGPSSLLPLLPSFAILDDTSSKSSTGGQLQHASGEQVQISFSAPSAWPSGYINHRTPINSIQDQMRAPSRLEQPLPSFSPSTMLASGHDERTVPRHDKLLPLPPLASDRERHHRQRRPLVLPGESAQTNQMLERVIEAISESALANGFQVAEPDQGHSPDRATRVGPAEVEPFGTVR